MADADPIAEQLAEKIARLDEQIAALVAERDRCRAALGALTEDGLTVRESNVKSDPMILQTRVRHSRGKSSASDDGVSKFVRVLNAAGYSIRALAELPGCPCSYGLLSMASRGDVSISRKVAEWVEARTKSEKYPNGYEATRSNWRKLRED